MVFLGGRTSGYIKVILKVFTANADASSHNGIVYVFVICPPVFLFSIRQYE
jgi:hypothetical protein